MRYSTGRGGTPTSKTSANALKSGDRDTDRGREGPREPSNVVRLPRDWLGPRSELVPFGPSAERQAREAARAADDADARLIEREPPSITQDDFWAGALDSIPHPVVGPEPAEPARPGLLRRLVPRSERAAEEPLLTSRPDAADLVAGPPASEPEAAHPLSGPLASVEAPRRPLAAPFDAARPLDEVDPEGRPARLRDGRRLAAGAAAIAATLALGVVGQAVLSGSSSAPGPATLAVVRTPSLSLPVISGGATTSPIAKPHRSMIHQVVAPRRAAHVVTHKDSAAASSYRSAPAYASYTPTASPAQQSTTTRVSTPSATSARSARPGPTGSGAPFGPGTLGS
jgi:hypothetical protein